MGIFTFLSNLFNSDNNYTNNSKSNKTIFQNKLYEQSLIIKSIEGRTVIVLAIIRNNKLLYNNSYNNNNYQYDSDGDIEFQGPIFKIELSLSNRDNFDIFYGIATNDREGVIMDLRDFPSMFDEYAVNILKEIQFKCPFIYDPELFVHASTRYAYHLYKNSTFCYMTNNYGTDAYFIHFKTGEYKKGNRDEIFKLIKTQTIEKEPTIEFFQPTTNSKNIINKIQGTIKINNIVNFGSYYFDNNVHKAPIQWRILRIENKKALLLSEFAIDCQPYHTSEENYNLVTWEKCDLRKWLNTVFYNEAFSSEEQNQICLTHLANPDNGSGRKKTIGGNDTNCKIFLLSIDEAKQYFSDDKDRACRLSKYAESKHKSEYSECRNGTVYCLWRLRSPGTQQDTAACVDTNGEVSEGGDYIWSTEEYIRPAICVNIDI